MSNILQISWEGILENKQQQEIIETVITECFKIEKLNEQKLIVSVILTTPQKIRELNKKHRKIDKETDVLSFPMFEKEEIIRRKQESKIEEILGDIVISIPRVEEQAKEYGHSVKRELAYMLVHGFYHLMGYDHIKEEDKKQMREKEEEILEKLKIER